MLGPKVFPVEVAGKETNWKWSKQGFGDKERPSDRTEVSEVVRGWEKRLTTEWVGLESMLVKGG